MELRPSNISSLISSFQFAPTLVTFINIDLQNIMETPKQHIQLKPLEKGDSRTEEKTGEKVPPIRKLKNMVRKMELQFKRGEKKLKVEGLSARFKIETLSDLYRLNEKFEEEYAREIITTLKNLGEKGFMVNVGAAQGFYAVYASLAGNSTLAIEPDPSTFNALQVNVSLNGLAKKIECIQCALGDVNGEADLFTSEVRNFSPSFIKTANHTKEVKVPILRMDEIVTHNPDILVMDVEGYEGNVLRGMGRLRPKEIFLEIHPIFLEKIKQDKNFVQKLLVEMGYELKSQYQRKNELLCHYIFKNGNLPSILNR